jgi:hypothetical protein
MITKKHALQIARDECLRREWPWNEQTSARWGIFVITIWGGGRKGANLHMKIRRRDGMILSAIMTPK